MPLRNQTFEFFFKIVSQCIWTYKLILLSNLLTIISSNFWRLTFPISTFKRNVPKTTSYFIYFPLNSDVSHSCISDHLLCQHSSALENGMLVIFFNIIVIYNFVSIVVQLLKNSNFKYYVGFFQKIIYLCSLLKNNIYL